MNFEPETIGQDGKVLKRELEKRCGSVHEWTFAFMKGGANVQEGTREWWARGWVVPGKRSCFEGAVVKLTGVQKEKVCV